MPCVEFEPTTPASERTKTVHALDRSATVTGDAPVLAINKLRNVRKLKGTRRYTGVSTNTRACVSGRRNGLVNSLFALSLRNQFSVKIYTATLHAVRPHSSYSA
jgi:hypothetical protein